MFATNCTLTGGGFDPARDITAMRGIKVIGKLLHSDKA
jgi:hypothetical protein